MRTDAPGGAPPLEFPLDWQGRIVARADAAALPGRIVQTLRVFGLAGEPALARRSAEGRYVTYAVRAVVPDRLTWQQLCYALSRLEGVLSVF